MKNYKQKSSLLILLLFIGFTNAFSQKCNVVNENGYDPFTDTDYKLSIGNLIYNDGGKAIITGFQDVMGLFAAKTIDDELFIYFQQHRIIDNDNSSARVDLSIGKGNELILRGDFGKITLTAENDYSPSTKVKTMTRQTQNTISSLYKINLEDLNKLCSGLITTIIVNYDTAPKLIKEIKEKDAKKLLKSWECAPSKLME